MDERKEIELEQDRAIVYIPHNALDCKLVCKVYLDGEIQTVECMMDMDEVREAVRKAAEGYIDEDDVFTLTEKGRRLAEEISRL